MKTYRIACTALALGASLALAQPAAPYQPSPASVKPHPVPQWLKDAKFGIYTHWGPNTHAIQHPSGGIAMGHYPGTMYQREELREYHKKHFGDPRTHGYVEVCRQFNPTKFDAEAWADLFVEAGARFAGPVAVHHDNFLMWDSAFNPWNIVQVGGLKRDTTRELQQACAGRGLKFMGAFHHAHSWNYYADGYKTGDCADPRYVALYNTPHERGAPKTRQFSDYFLNSTREAWQNYAMDMIWFDFGFTGMPEETQLAVYSEYYNWAAANNKDVILVQKNEKLHDNMGGLLDFERKRPREIVEPFWMTDATYRTWYYRPNINGSTDRNWITKGRMIDILVDIVSKNGCLLLNIGPDYLGRIDQEQTEALKAIGAWLRVNGEGIYATRHWKVHGEGSVITPLLKESRGRFNQFDANPENAYRSDDLRFTQSSDGKAVYVFALDWPADRMTIHSMKVLEAGAGAAVELLGYSGKLDYEIDPDSGKLSVALPATAPQGLDYAYGFKLTGFELELIPRAAAQAEEKQPKRKP